MKPSVRELESLLEKNPDDVFLNYGLAMALRSAGRLEEAVARLDRTLTLDPDYVPAYFQKAQILAELGRIEDARGALQQGMAKASDAGDRHAREEMAEFLATLESS